MIPNRRMRAQGVIVIAMADQEKNPQRSPPTEDAREATRRLLRSRSERMLWGVAGGLGEYLRIDPTLVRLGFAVTALFGGIGLIAYLVMAVVVPEDDGTGQPFERIGVRRSSGARPARASWLLIALPGGFWGMGRAARPLVGILRAPLERPGRVVGDRRRPRYFGGRPRRDG